MLRSVWTWCLLLTLALGCAGVGLTAEKEATPVEQAVQSLVTITDWGAMYTLAQGWQKDMDDSNRKQLIIALLQRITSTKETPFTTVDDMAVASRLEKGLMKFQGHGFILQHDVFIEGGRCAWAIEVLLHRERIIPPVTADLTPQQRTELEKTASYRIIEVMELPTAPADTVETIKNL